MDAKKQKSTEDINKRIENLSKIIEGSTEADWVAILLRGKSPQYNKRFSAWAKHTLESSYFEDMVGAMTVSFAMMLLLTREEDVNFVKGEANAVLFMLEEMRRLSNIQEFNQEK